MGKWKNKAKLTFQMIDNTFPVRCEEETLQLIAEMVDDDFLSVTQRRCATLGPFGERNNDDTRAVPYTGIRYSFASVLMHFTC